MDDKALIFLSRGEIMRASEKLEEGIRKDKDGHWFLGKWRIRPERKYPYMSIGERVISAAKAAYDVYPEKRKVPASEVYAKYKEDHKMLMVPTCGEPECINPEHLEPRLPKEHSAKTALVGEAHPMTKLTDYEIEEMLREYKTGVYTVNELVERYGISRVTFYHYRKRFKNRV
jgi:hypothetical protein